MRGVEIEVQLQDIDTGFAEKAELAALGVLFDERSDFSFRHISFAGHAGSLERRRPR